MAAGAGGPSRSVSHDYWDGASQGKLILQQCGACGRIRHYPRPLCDACYSFDVLPVESPGTGVVYSWTVTHHAFAPSVSAELPYVLVTADLAEGVRVLGRMAPGPPAPRVGLPVRVAFEAGPEGPLLMLVAEPDGSESGPGT